MYSGNCFEYNHHWGLLPSATRQIFAIRLSRTEDGLPREHFRDQGSTVLEGC